MKRVQDVNNKVFIIAEAGVNHNGGLPLAKRMIDVAKSCGADAIKFQTFKAENLICKFVPKAAYQKEVTNKNESQFEMLKRLELDVKDYGMLKSYCDKKKIMFLSSPFDLESIDLLNRLGLKIFKVPSGEITNLPYLKKMGDLKKKIIMSSGMANLKEIGTALKILEKAGILRKNITVLHCNTEYPTPFEDVNLRAMLTIRDRFKVKVGYSDHTLGIEIPIAAVALGASVIEKHFTLNRNMRGPDHKASLEPQEFKKMVDAIRNIEKAFGDGIKRLSHSEYRNKAITRKSIVAARNIKKGEIFSEDNLTTKRPALGISPLEWDNIIGRVAKSDFKKDVVIGL